MDFSMSNLNSAELGSVSDAIQNPENLGNNSALEIQWAMKAMEHANIHYNLISSVDASLLKLTKLDDTIYAKFREDFPDFQVDKVTEDSLKSADAKAKWREFSEGFKGQVEDYNQGTLLRMDCTGDYEPDNTILTVRVQFLAIEIARNREGHNAAVRQKKLDASS